jgi:hypothetical protein
MDQAESGRGCWVDRPAASATDVSAFVIGVCYLLLPPPRQQFSFHKSRPVASTVPRYDRADGRGS